MEKIPCICMMSDLCRAMAELENNLTIIYDISLNEAMVLCCIGGDRVAAGEIAQATRLKASHLSKVLRLLEDKGFLQRDLGERDKRQMYFSLTNEGTLCLTRLKQEGLPIPEFLGKLLEGS